MKKLLVSSLAIVTVFAAVAFAADNSAKNAPAKPAFTPQGLTPEMKAQIEKAKKEVQAKREEHRKQDVELKQLLQEYQAAKPNSEAQKTAKEKMVKILVDMRKEQLNGQENALKELKERVGFGEKDLQEQKKESALNLWAGNGVEHLVQSNGNMQAVFAGPTIMDKVLAPYRQHQGRPRMMPGKAQQRRPQNMPQGQNRAPKGMMPQGQAKGA